MFGCYLLMIQRIFICILCVYSLFFVSHDAISQDCTNLSGSWINQDSSILKITRDENGSIHGTYQSNASDDPVLHSWTGVVNRHADPVTFAFSISWGDYGSITSWTGYCSESGGELQLTTLWHLVRPYVEYDWERFVTNSSSFTPLKK